ncbi:MAG: PorV/PorQ family protein, partial [Bacteroidota bacterium]|nr:PorV/PorQ family protein [Bacteroidota bacterium]
MEFRKLLFLLTSMIVTSPAFSQVGGNNTYEFLNLPISARVSSLGGSLISTQDNDINLALTNPALISDSMDNNIALSYVNYFADVNYGYAAYAKTFKNIGTFTAGIQYLDYGKFNRADNIGNIDGTFSANESSLNIGYARSIIDSNFTVGATLK